MRPFLDTPDPRDAEEARALQAALSARIELRDRRAPVRRIAGVDVAYAEEGDRAYAAVVVLDAQTLAVLEQVAVATETPFPYVPGLLSFREIPPLREALARLRAPADLIVCDGQGRAHPSRFGLACHLGVLYDVPTIGCGKTRLIGQHREPGRERGRYALLREGGEVIGHVLRTQSDVRPIYVSVGHAMSLGRARELVLGLCTSYRLPETTRAADHLANATRREAEGNPARSTA